MMKLSPSAGLSPRVRGNLAEFDPSRNPPGSIPTRAGKPQKLLIADMPGGVYPHACGETDRAGPTRPSRRGLSPRVRGNQQQIVDPRLERGSIPTRGGKPLFRHMETIHAGVYPHACGETAMRSGHVFQGPGLSPRVRGTCGKGPADQPGEGLSPRVRGKPCGASASSSLSRVYPHACGETARSARARRLVRGLSPRVRGNRGLASAGWTDLGSIPTRAGKPVMSSAPARKFRVYPHACGETLPATMP